MMNAKYIRYRMAKLECGLMSRNPHSSIRNQYESATIQREAHIPSLAGEGRVRRIKIKKIAYFEPLILTFSLREKGLFTYAESLL